MKKVNKIKLVKTLLFVLVMGITVGIIIYMLPMIKDISTPNGQIEFKEKIDSLGIYGVLVLIVLQFAQIFLIVLPGEPLEVLAGMCYGSIGGTIFICSTVFVTTTIIVLLVRKFGKKFIYEFFNEEKIDKIENSKIFKDTKAVEFIMMILFLIPGTPKDLLVYIGGILPIKPIRFILISTFVRLPSVITSTIAGANIADGNIKNTIIIYIITFLISVTIIILANKFDKNKMTKEALETIK